MPYAVCCQPLHDGTRTAPTAEALMRSRYAAYVLENAPYVLASWDPATRPPDLHFLPGQVWLSLKVLASHTDGDTATVEFIARSRIGGNSYALHEVSRFTRIDGGWFYRDGTVM